MVLWLGWRLILPAFRFVLSFMAFSFPRSDRLKLCRVGVAIISDQILVPRERRPRLCSCPQNCNYRPLVEAAGVTRSAVSAACAPILPVAKEHAVVP